LRWRARLLPRGGRPTLHGRAAAGGRHRGAGPARQGQGPRRRARRGPRAVRQRPSLRGLFAARGRAEQRLLQRHARSVQRPPRAVGRARPGRAAAPPRLRAGGPPPPPGGGPAPVRRLSEPLGWAVTAEPVALDGEFPEWGDSRYVRLVLESEQLTLAEVLR